jgi:hypothetical protein
MGQDTAEMLALKLPHLAPIAEELDTALGVVKTQNRGWGRICFNAQGIDGGGNLIIDSVETVLKFLNKRKKIK